MHTAHRPSHLRAKRVVDVVLALVLIVLTAPLMVTVAVLVAVRLVARSSSVSVALGEEAAPSRC